MKVDILERSFCGAHLAIMADIEGNVPPSQTPIKARMTMTSQGNSSLLEAIVDKGSNNLKESILIIFLHNKSDMNSNN